MIAVEELIPAQVNVRQPAHLGPLSNLLGQVPQPSPGSVQRAEVM